MFLTVKKGELKEAYIGKGKIINSSFLNGLEVEQAKEKIISEIETKKLEKENFVPIEGLGYFTAKILGVSNTNALSRRW